MLSEPKLVFPGLYYIFISEIKKMLPISPIIEKTQICKKCYGQQ